MPSPRRAAWVLALLVLAGCAHASSERRAGPLRIVATTSTLASLARGAAGPGADVRSLVPVGVSPEDFQPSPDAIAALRDADVLVENGVGLESWLEPTIRNSGNPNLRIVVCGDGLPVVNGNPHLWMDPVFARAYVGKIRDALIAVDAAKATAYRASATAYQAQLDALRTRTQRKIASIPPAQRAMIRLVQRIDTPQRCGNRDTLIVDFLGIADDACHRAETPGNPHRTGIGERG